MLGGMKATPPIVAPFALSETATGTHLSERPTRSTETAPPAHVKDRSSLTDSQTDPQADTRAESRHSVGQPPRCARLHLLIGPVGAGKSTFALGLAREHAALRLTLDAWLTVLFSPDRPQSGVIEWYGERAARCVDQIWSVASDVLALGTDVILEIGLLRRRERSAFYRRVETAGIELSVYVLDAPRDVRRQRVSERNRTQGTTFSMIVPPAIFELASDLWEPPEPDECRGRDVRNEPYLAPGATNGSQ